MKKLFTLILAVVMILSASSMMALAESENTKIIIGATSAPHAQILEVVQPLLAEKGIELEIVVYTDYVTPNMALSDDSLDANYFQHIPYLSTYNATLAEGEQLVPAIGVHYEPYALYPGKVASIEELKDGDVIAITNDPANEARALNLLANAGLITLADGVGINATIYDIVEKSINIEFLEVEAAQLPRDRQDVAMAVINGNYAIEAGLSMNDALFVERTDDEVGVAYTNYVVVRPEDAEAEWVEILREVICSQEVANYINNNEAYAGGVIPVFTVETEETAE